MEANEHGFYPKLGHMVFVEPIDKKKALYRCTYQDCGREVKKTRAWSNASKNALRTNCACSVCAKKIQHSRIAPMLAGVTGRNV